MPLLTSAERVGTRVADKYELVRVLGRGGMGVVYEAVHRFTGRRVAVKLLQPALADDPDLATRFLNEARAASRVRHPNVVDVLDMGRDDDGTVYQVLELLEGETLGARLRREQRLSVEDCARVLLPVMEALCLLHARGIVHRDLKPDNVFLRRDGGELTPVLLDFGMAKLLDGGAVTRRSSEVFGTPFYMSPEQAVSARAVGPQTDVWAIGVMWFECLTGQLPHGHAPAAAYLARVLYEAPASLGSLAPQLSEALARAIDDALARDLARRPASMAAFVERVRTGLRDAPASIDALHAEPPSWQTPSARRTRGRARLAAAGALLLVTLFVLVERGRSSARESSAARPVSTAAAERPTPKATDRAAPSAALASPLPTEPAGANGRGSRPSEGPRSPSVVPRRAVRASAAASPTQPTELPLGMTEEW